MRQTMLASCSLVHDRQRHDNSDACMSDGDQLGARLPCARDPCDYTRQLSLQHQLARDGHAHDGGGCRFKIVCQALSARILMGKRENLGQGHA
eukprot:1146793-Pelagomonas_calceolata.AAC.3